METSVSEVGDRIYRLSTFIPEAGPTGLTFNQYLVDADEPLLFHLGMRGLFPLVSAALARVVPLGQVRWLSFGHVEADENGSMNQWLAAAPRAQVVHGEVGVMVQLNDQADRPPHALADGATLDLGGRRVRLLATPHLPHNWESVALYEEVTGTLLCGDLFTQAGPAPALTGADLVGPALETERLFPGGSAYTAQTPVHLARLAALAPRTLCLMHGPAFRGDGAAQLRALAQEWERLERARVAAA